MVSWDHESVLWRWSPIGNAVYIGAVEVSSWETTLPCDVHCTSRSSLLCLQTGCVICSCVFRQLTYTGSWLIFWLFCSLPVSVSLCLQQVPPSCQRPRLVPTRVTSFCPWSTDCDVLFHRTSTPSCLLGVFHHPSDTRDWVSCCIQVAYRSVKQ